MAGCRDAAIFNGILPLGIAQHDEESVNLNSRHIVFGLHLHIRNIFSIYVTIALWVILPADV